MGTMERGIFKLPLNYCWYGIMVFLLSVQFFIHFNASLAF